MKILELFDDDYQVHSLSISLEREKETVLYSLTINTRVLYHLDNAFKTKYPDITQVTMAWQLF